MKTQHMDLYRQIMGLIQMSFKWHSAKSCVFDGQGSFTWNNFKENGINIIDRRYIGSFSMNRRDGEGNLFGGFGGIWNGECTLHTLS